MNRYGLPVKSAKGQELVYINTHLSNSLLSSILFLLVLSLFGATGLWLGTLLVDNLIVMGLEEGHAVDILGINLNTNETHIETGEDPNKNLNNYYIYKSPVYAIDDGEVIDTRNRINGPTVIENIAGLYSVFINVKLMYVPWQVIFGILGNYIVIKHKNGTYSLYAHLCKDTIKVKKGDKVKRGDIIALVGNTGFSSEPHLHFQICKINPKFMEWTTTAAIASFKLGSPLAIPTTIDKELTGFETHKYIPIVNNYKDNLAGSADYIKKSFQTENIWSPEQKNKAWKINNTGKIYPFCVIKHMK